MSKETQETVPANEIRIGIKSKPKDIIAKCEKLIKEDKIKDLHLSAISNSIGELVITAEILKSMFPELVQKSIFSTIEPRNTVKDKNPISKNLKLYPRLEIILSKDKSEQNKDDAPKISEEDRKILIDTIDGQKEAFKKRNKRFQRRSYRRRRKNRNRSLRFNRNRQKYAYSPRKSSYNSSRRKPSFNNKRKPFARPVSKRRNNLNRNVKNNKINRPYKNGNRPVYAKN